MKVSNDYRELEIPENSIVYCDIPYKVIGMQYEPLLPTVLSLEEILRDAVRRKATYQVQFADYDLDTWTAPSILTQNRMDKVLDDGSIRKIRLELEH